MPNPLSQNICSISFSLILAIALGINIAHAQQVNPPTLNAIPLSASQVSLSWNSTAAAYQLERCSGIPSICTVFYLSGTGFTDNALSPLITYAYRVKGIDFSGVSGAYSSPVGATTHAAPANPPPLISLLANGTTFSPPGSVALSASASDEGSINQVEFFLGNALIGSDTSAPYSYTYGRLLAGSYVFQARAMDNLGAMATSNPVTVLVTAGADTTAPTVPLGLTATVLSSSQIALAWSQASDTSGPLSYELERCTTGFSGVCSSFFLGNTSFTDRMLLSQTSYRYRVRAMDRAGNRGGWSGEVEATPGAVPTSYTLSVAVTGNGTVTSNPGGITCGTTCGASYSNGTSVTLSATAANGFNFTGWGGACNGAGVCTISMTQARSVTATFIQNSVDLNCTSTWTGSEENTTITAWPYRDCFRTDPVAGRRTRLSANTGGAVAWEQGTGWNGQNALRVRPPDGSPDLSPPDGIPDRIQGYAGLGIHNFHAVRTKRLNIRYLLRYNSNWALYAQGTKWDIAVKYDYTNPSAPVRREGCDRGINATASDPLNTGRKRFVIHQGVCTAAYNVPHLDGFSTGPNVRENEWISVENEFDLETGWYRIYITTRDGTYNQSLTSEINIGAGAYGAPIEAVPNPYWWGSIDCSTGCFWGWTNDLGTVPRPADTYIWFSHFVMSNTRIGPPAGFVQ